MSSGFSLSVFYSFFLVWPHNLPDYKQAEDECILHYLFSTQWNGDVVIWLVDASKIIQTTTFQSVVV